MDYDLLTHKREYSKNCNLVNWCMGNQCNYSCSYCPDGLHSGSTKWPAINDAKKFVKRMHEHFKDKIIYYELTGGEVTLWKNLIILLSFIKSYGNSNICIISNGSRGIDFWEGMRNYLNHIALSFHSETTEIEHFMDVIGTLNGHMRVHLNIIMNPNDYFFNKGIELADKAIDKFKNFTIGFQPLQENLGGPLYKYTNEQMQIIKNQVEWFKKIKQNKEFDVPRGALVIKNSKTGEMCTTFSQELVTTRKNQWTGWECFAGIENIVVDMDGNIFRGWCKQGGIIGNITGTITFPSKPIICGKRRCHCGTDILCTKRKVQ